MLSVIIPMRNAETFIDEALGSVVVQPEVKEIIVVDDGSSDDSARKAEELGTVVMLRQPAGGPGAARNAGVRASRQPYVAFLDADDIWLADKIAHQIRALRDAPGTFAYCAFELFVEPGERPPRTFRAEQLGKVFRTPVPSGLVLHRDVLRRVGEFNEDLQTAEDVDWFSRATSLGVLGTLVDRVLLRKRIHAKNTSLATLGNTRRLFDVLRARVHFQRETD
jgi:glycosyltransferase involved in cell wall biosynthesis